jgi:hypothetical protein
MKAGQMSPAFAFAASNVAQTDMPPAKKISVV